MNIAIYARVSSETQAREGTIESQIEALKEYAKTHDLTIIQEFIDNGYSGSELNRPGLDQLRDVIQEGKIEGILILSPDRLSRKQAHQIILMEEFKKRHIQVIFTNQQFDDSPEAQLMLQIQGSLAEYERAKILDRTRRGRNHAVKNGQVLGGRAPYGYKFVHKTDKTRAHWEINPQEAEIVRRIYTLYLQEGLRGESIAYRFNEEGIPTRSGYNKWWPSVIFDILKSPTYTGTAYMFRSIHVEPKQTIKRRDYRKRNYSIESRPQEDWIPLSVPKIIDQQVWDAVQQQIKMNINGSKRNNSRNDYLLRGLVTCGLCGSTASGSVSNQRSYYRCNASRSRKNTFIPHGERVSIHRADLDQKVWDGLVYLLDDPARLEEQLQKRLEKKINPANLPAPDEKLNKELEKLDFQEKRIIDAYRESVISLDELKEQKAKIANSRAVIQEKIKAAQNRKEETQPEITMEMLGDISARYHKVMANADFATREKLVKLLINSVKLYPNKAIVEGIIPVASIDALITSNHKTTRINSGKWEKKVGIGG